MATTEVTIEITRWMLLRLWPRIWLDGVRTVGVSPVHPKAIWLFFFGVWTFLVSRRPS